MPNEHKEDFMEFLEATTGNITPGAPVNVTIPIPCVPDERIVCLIHQLHFVPTELVPPVSESCYFRAILGLAACDQLGVPDALAMAWWMMVAQNATARAGALLAVGDIQHFDPPLLIARRELIMRANVDAATGTPQVDLKIGYTLARVPLDRMLRALVE